MTLDGTRSGVLFARIEQAGRPLAEIRPLLPDRYDHRRSAAWRDAGQAEPEFVRRARALFDAHRHKAIATLRADGVRGWGRCSRTPSWVSVPWRMRVRARALPESAARAAIAQRSTPVVASEVRWPGEAKISGRAVAAEPVTERADGGRFHADIAAVVHTHLDEEPTMLAVGWWTPGTGCDKPDATDR